MTDEPTNEEEIAKARRQASRTALVGLGLFATLFIILFGLVTLLT